MLAAMCNGVLAAYKQFGMPSFATLLYNILTIVFILLWGAPNADGAVGMARGVAISAFACFVYQLFLARKFIVNNYQPLLNRNDPGFRRLIRLAIPTLISGSVVQLNAIVLTKFTNQFQGAVTSLRQAQTTWQLPYGIIVVSFGSVMLPIITEHFAVKDYKAVRRIYTGVLRNALFYVVPFAVLFFVNRFETIQAIFKWNNGGTYTDLDVRAGADILRFFCVALVAQTIVFITNQAFYARKITRITLLIGITTLILNPIFCVLYVNVFKAGISGLSMAYMSTSIISAVLLYTFYNIHIPAAKPYRLLPFAVKVGICAAATAVVLMAVRALPLYPNGKMLQLLSYLLKALIGFSAYFIAALALRLREAENSRTSYLIYWVFKR